MRTALGRNFVRHKPLFKRYYSRCKSLNAKERAMLRNDKRFQALLRWPVAALAGALLAACGGNDAISLDDKLHRQFERFDAVRALVVETYSDPSRSPVELMITRDRWESLLAPTAEDAFSADDLAALRRRQASEVAASRQRAIERSVIDFSEFRALPAVQAEQRIRAFCSAVPKGGMLHIHPWGTLDPDSVKALLERNDPLIPAAQLAFDLSDPEGEAWLYPEELDWLRGLADAAPYSTLAPADQDRFRSLLVLPPGVHAFPRFEAMFSFVGLLLGVDWDNTVKMFEDFASRAVQQGVFYVEFTESIAPHEVAAYEVLGQHLLDRYGLTVRFNNAFFRTSSAAFNANGTLDMLRNIHSPWIVGIDLLANENGTPALETGQVIYGPVLANAELQGGSWRRTMHAGELGDDRNPRDAMLLGAERLGHGVRLERDPVALQYAAMHRIAIEINLTSNLKLGAVDDIAKHPYLTFLRLGLPVSLATDDEGMFDTDAVGECVLAVGKTDLTYDEYRRMAFNSIHTAFIGDTLKQQFLERLEHEFAVFERSPVAQAASAR